MSVAARLVSRARAGLWQTCPKPQCAHTHTQQRSFSAAASAQCTAVRPQLDIRTLVGDPGAAAKNAVDRQCDDAVLDAIPRIVELHSEVAALRRQVESLRSEKKRLGQRHSEVCTDSRAAANREGVVVRERLGKLKVHLEAKDAELTSLAALLPNTTHAATPCGGEEACRVLHNSEERGGAGVPEFDFVPQDHVTIGSELGLFDLEAGSAVAGAKFAYLTGAGALLELALVSFAMHTMASRGYTPVLTPDVVKQSVVEACGFAPRGRSAHAQSYSIEETDLVLAATAEAPLAGMWAGRRLPAENMPFRQVGFSHCFRTEVGSRGAEVRGLYRLHQFSKVEMFVVSSAAQSATLLEELREASEEILQMLGLHYRVLEMASAELGCPAHRKYDVEAWMPGRKGGDGAVASRLGQFGEVASISNCTDYQARRLHIRVRAPGGSRSEFAHTLNGTALAVPRVLIALLETYQQADGSVIVPEVLRSYLGGMDVLVPVRQK